MKIYTLILKQKSGLLSELQSDTIYGHFCWRLKDQFGVEKLKEFISVYQQKKPVFLLSDGLLKIGNEILFPRPLLFSKPDQKKKKTDKIIEFTKQKKSKERRFLTIEEMNTFLNSGKIVIDDRNDFIGKGKISNKSFISEQLRTSVQIDRSSFTSSEGMLFSYNPTYPRNDVEYCVMVKILDENIFKVFNCENVLKEVFHIGFGKKKSSGYGQFSVADDFKEFSELQEPSNPNAMVVLGNYLPDDNDSVKPIGYEIKTKYGRLGEELSLSENPFKKPIIFLTAGSCFHTSQKKKYYGRITDQGEISPANPQVVQFGMPFFLEFSINE